MRLLHLRRSEYRFTRQRCTRVECYVKEFEFLREEYSTRSCKKELARLYENTIFFRPSSVNLVDDENAPLNKSLFYASFNLSHNFIYPGRLTSSL